MRRILLGLGLTSLLSFVGLTPTLAQPASYDEFCKITQAQFDGLSHDEIEDLFSGCPSGEAVCEQLCGGHGPDYGHLYLGPGDYKVSSEIDIDRATPLYLHGGNRRKTVLRRDTSAGQIVRITGATPLVNLTGLTFQRVSDNYAPLVASGIRVVTTGATRLEILECVFEKSGVLFRSAGELQIQATFMSAKGLLAAPVYLDHAEADLVMIGGNISNYDAMTSKAPNNQGTYHLWAKQGRMRVVSTSVQHTLARADFRIDAATEPGKPHVIAGVRSEGTDKTCAACLPSSFIYVPESSAVVDVIVMNSSGSWPAPCSGGSSLADHRAQGTLWLIGNNASSSGVPVDPLSPGPHVGGAGSLVADCDAAPDGSCSSLPPECGGTCLALSPANPAQCNLQNTVVAIGNRIRYEDDPFPNAGSSVIGSKNLYSFLDANGDLAQPDPPNCVHGQADPSCKPYDRYIADQPASNPLSGAPPIPPTEFPLPLVRPAVLQPLPDMVNLANHGNNVQAALDAALNTTGTLFIPAGTYPLTAPLYYIHTGYAGLANPITNGDDRSIGAWIAGPDAETTILHHPGGTVFTTEGLIFGTLQGLTFRTGSTVKAAVDLENVNFFGAPTSEIVFHDCVFDGGRYGLGLGLTTNSMNSEMMFVDSTFQNATFGLAVGTDNALNNVVYRGRFLNNGTGVGHPGDIEGSGHVHGGTWALLGASFRGSTEQDLRISSSSDATWYSHGVDSDSNEIAFLFGSASAAPTVFDHSVFNVCGTAEPPESPRPWLFRSGIGGGPIFLHSRVGQGTIEMAPGLTSNFMLRLQSDIASWDASVQLLPGEDPQIPFSPFSRSDELDPALPLCFLDSACEDCDPCTTDTCADGTCVNAPCDDGIECTVDACGPSGCEIDLNHGACDDGNPCTIDSCTVTGCDHDYGNCQPCSTDTDCDDGDSCSSDTCVVDFGLPGSSDGFCHFSSACYDDNECTVDSCDENGCVHQPTDSLCDDGVECTLDQCSASGCQNVPASMLCDDGQSCTDDICTGNGCIFVDNCPKNKVCHPYNRCVTPTVCANDVQCDDGYACTNDVCIMDFGASTGTCDHFVIFNCR